MKTLRISSVVLLVIFVAAWTAAQETKPTVEKTDNAAIKTDWHRQMVGDWDVEGKGDDGSGAGEIQISGTETVKTFGNNWIITEGVIQLPGGGTMDYRMTLGYDPDKEKYVGSWICDQMTTHWMYEGSLDESGTTLTLATEGPNPSAGGKKTKFRDVIEMKDKDLRVHRSMMQTDDGEWVEFASSQYRRKK
jgi:hypothetical protein